MQIACYSLNPKVMVCKKSNNVFSDISTRTRYLSIQVWFTWTSKPIKPTLIDLTDRFSSTKVSLQGLIFQGQMQLSLTAAAAARRHMPVIFIKETYWCRKQPRKWTLDGFGKTVIFTIYSTVWWHMDIAIPENQGAMCLKSTHIMKI